MELKAKTTGKNILQAVNQALEWLGLITVMNYCLYCFFCATTFYFNFTDLYRTVSFAAAVGIGTLRLGTTLFLEFSRATSATEKKEAALKYVLGVLAAVPCILVAHRFGYTAFAYLPFLAFCLCGTDTARVLKCFTICIGTVLAATILCALGGSITNLVYLNQGKGRIRGSYGVAYPTDFASYLIFLLLFVWAVGKKYSGWHTGLFAALALMVTWLVYTYPHSETSTICGLVTAAVVLYDGLDHTFLSRNRKLRWFSKAAEALTVGAFPLLGVLFFGMTWLYGHGNGLATWMNQWMSNRLLAVLEAIQQYGIHALGAATPQEGGGHSLIHNAQYEFLDSTFGLILVRYGWVLALLLTGLWVWMTWRVIRKGNKRLALTLAVIAVHSFSEHHFTELNFNILLAMPLCTMAMGKKQEQAAGITEKSTRQKRLVISKTLEGLAVAGAAAAALALLPKLLSRFRAVVTMKGWTGGGSHSLPAFLLCVAGFAALAGICFLLIQGIREAILDRQVPWTPLLWMVSVACLLAVGIRWSNDKIQVWASKQEARMTADAAAIQTTLSVATEPVYAGQMEEAYKRRFSGFSDRIFSPEELGKGGKGTILVEKEREAQQLIGTGAVYCQISDYTGLYTYDDAVAETLSKAGYRVHGYYSTERKEDLVAVAPTNGLLTTETGGVMLWGPEHSLVHGPYLDQFGGTYQATFELDIDPIWLTDNREICTLRVSAGWGQSILAETTVRANEFEADYTVKVSLPYSISAAGSPGVEFLVFAKDDIPMNVRRISWARTVTTDVRRKYTAEGYILSERYFTAEGDPQVQTAGHYGVSYEYKTDNGAWSRMQYLDADGKTLKMISSGYAQVTRQYNVLHQVAEERYLDAEGNPCLCTGNYAGYKRTYDGHGNILTNEYFDGNGQLIRSTNGYAIAEYTYDDRNNRTSERYLGEDRHALLLNSGYAEIHRVYNKMNRVAVETYYGTDGQPIALSKNQAGIAYEYDEIGNTIGIRYLNIYGKPALLTDNYCEIRRKYSSTRKLLEESYYDPEGNPCNAYERYSKIKHTYDAMGQLSLTAYFDAEGNLLQCGSSYLHEYLQALKGRNITIFITVRDEATNSLTGKLLEDLKEIGVRTDLKGKYRYSYYAVITQGDSVEGLSNTETITYAGQLGNIEYSIISGGYAVGNISSILINGMEYSKNTRGMNFVILDNATGTVIDSVSFDTYDQEIQVIR